MKNAVGANEHSLPDKASGSVYILFIRPNKSSLSKAFLQMDVQCDTVYNVG